MGVMGPAVHGACSAWGLQRLEPAAHGAIKIDKLAKLIV